MTLTSRHILFNASGTEKRQAAWWRSNILIVLRFDCWGDEKAHNQIGILVKMPGSVQQFSKRYILNVTKKEIFFRKPQVTSRSNQKSSHHSFLSVTVKGIPFLRSQENKKTLNLLLKSEGSWNSLHTRNISYEDIFWVGTNIP